MVKFWIKALRVFATAWFIVAGGLIAIGLIMIGLREGFDAVQQTLSPFNVFNLVAVVVTLLPGIGARLLADRLAQSTHEHQVHRSGNHSFTPLRMRLREDRWCLSHYRARELG